MARTILARRCLLSAILALSQKRRRISHHSINNHRNRSLCRRNRSLCRVVHNRNIHRHHNPDTSSRVTNSHTSGRHHNPDTTHNQVTHSPTTTRHHNPDTSSRVTNSHTSGKRHNPDTTHNRVTPTPVTHSPTTTRHHNLDTMPSQVPSRASNSPSTSNLGTTLKQLASRLTRQQKFNSQCSRMCSVFSSGGSVRCLCFSRTASAGRSFGNTRGTTSIFN